MIPPITKNDLIVSLTQIKSLIPAITSVNPPNPPTEFKQGEKYSALVEKILPNNTAEILVANKKLQIQLPEVLQPGEKLTLTVSSTEPQLKFAIVNEAPLETQDRNTSLSSTGRFLGNLMQDLFKNQNTSQTQTVTSQTPITTSAHLNSAELPGLLQKAINQSGLFYESHQAKWVNGENTLENLRQEPQGKISVMTPDPSTLKTQAASQLPVTDLPIHSQSLPLVTQQLSTLETGQLFWRGEVWKNQSMDWDIYEEKQENKQSESEYVAPWHSKIRLNLPNLGEVLVKIALTAQDVSIKIDAVESETMQLLKNNQHPLANDMQAAGLNIQSIEINRHDANL